MKWRELFARIGPPRQLNAELREKIRRSFDESANDEERFPSTIDPRIAHVRLILEFFGNLDGKRVLDVGCGKGRFARVLQDGHPAAEIWGLDISPAMLSYVPEPIRTRTGSMTELPFPEAHFDCVYATESLEHAVEIERAVDEMCRVVKAGGKIVIIDKNAEHFGRLATPEWERWFSKREIERMLARHCREVHSQPISYWKDLKPDGMFLAWTAVK